MTSTKRVKMSKDSKENIKPYNFSKSKCKDKIKFTKKSVKIVKKKCNGNYNGMKDQKRKCFEETEQKKKKKSSLPIKCEGRLNDIQDNKVLNPGTSQLEYLETISTETFSNILLTHNELKVLHHKYKMDGHYRLNDNNLSFSNIANSDTSQETNSVNHENHYKSCNYNFTNLNNNLSNNFQLYTNLKANNIDHNLYDTHCTAQDNIAAQQNYRYELGSSCLIRYNKTNTIDNTRDNTQLLYNNSFDQIHNNDNEGLSDLSNATNWRNMPGLNGIHNDTNIGNEILATNDLQRSGRDNFIDSNDYNNHNISNVCPPISQTSFNHNNNHLNPYNDQTPVPNTDNNFFNTLCNVITEICDTKQLPYVFTDVNVNSCSYEKNRGNGTIMSNAPSTSFVNSYEMQNNSINTGLSHLYHSSESKDFLYQSHPDTVDINRNYNNRTLDNSPINIMMQTPSMSNFHCTANSNHSTFSDK